MAFTQPGHTASLTWWIGRSIEEQESLLQEFDPKVNEASPFKLDQWARDWRRVRRARRLGHPRVRLRESRSERVERVILDEGQRIEMEPEMPGRRPWWHGWTLDHQQGYLHRYNPTTNPRSPFTLAQWNGHQQRIRQAREKVEAEVRKLRKLCRCKWCIESCAPPFPAYYVTNGLSYECRLEGRTIQRDSVERIGSALASSTSRIIQDYSCATIEAAGFRVIRRRR